MKHTVLSILLFLSLLGNVLAQPKKETRDVQLTEAQCVEVAMHVANIAHKVQKEPVPYSHEDVRDVVEYIIESNPGLEAMSHYDLSVGVFMGCYQAQGRATIPYKNRI